MTDHSYEEIRRVTIDVLAGREKCQYDLNQYGHLKIGVGQALYRRDHNGQEVGFTSSAVALSTRDSETFLEVFWDLFRQGILTLGYNDSNNGFPWCRLSAQGKRLVEGGDPYFFHDLSSYEKVIRENIHQIDDATLIYVKEAMQAFLSGCVLSASVMIGVAVEHTFERLLETIQSNPTHAHAFTNVFTQKTALQRLTKFRNILDQNPKLLPPEVRESLDTNFLGVMDMIRTFRNESGHPSGKIISREQCYVLLQLFIPCCKKVYELLEFFRQP